MDVPKNLCNDLNKLSIVNIISLAIDYGMNRKVNFAGWKDGFLGDIGILMIYHQALSFLSEKFDDSDMVDDLIKTTVLILVPTLFAPKWKELIIMLLLVVVYHKIIRQPLVTILKDKGLGFDEGIEDIVETLLLLAFSKDINAGNVLNTMASLGIYHSIKHYIT